MTDRSVSIALIAKVSGFVAGIKTAEASVSKLNAQIAASAKKQQSLRELGNAAGAMGAAAAIGLYAVVKSAASFESAMSRVAATGDDAKQNMDALHDAAIAAGAATKFSATEAADGITELLKANVSAKDVLEGGLAGALNLAAAGELDVADAANIMATAMSQFELPGTQATHVADLLAAAAGKAQGEVGDMAQALKYVGPVAAQMGVSIEETTGTIAELANKGILASQAGTSLRGMLSALTSPSEVARKELEKYNIELYDAQGNFVGFEGVAGQLQQRLGNLGNAERDEALGRIFGNQQITAARILYAGGAKDVQKWTDAVNDNGFAAETAATKMDNLSGDLEQLRGSLETALITTGEGSQGPLREVVQLLTELVNAYNELPGPVKNGVVALTALVAVVGLSAFAASRAVIAYQNFGKNLATLGIQAETVNKKMLLIRGGALATAGGLQLLDSQVGDSNQSLHSLLTVASGAAAGFAVGGPWGAAVGGAAGILSLFAGANQKAAQDVEGLSSTLDEQTGALTINSRAWAAKQITDAGALDAANQLGISAGELTDGLLDQGDAADQLRTRLQGVIDANQRYLTSKGAAVPVDNDTAAAARTLLDVLDDTNGTLAKSRAEWKFNHDAAAAAGDAAGKTAGQVDTLAEAQKRAVAETKQLSNAMEHLQGVLSDRSSLRDYEAALDAARKASKSNADITKEGTEKQRKAQEAFDAAASAAIAHAQAMNEDGKHTAEAQKFLRGARDDLIDLAKKFNTGKLSAKEYADQVLKLKQVGDIPVTVHDNFDAARARLAGIVSLMNTLRAGASVTVDVNAGGAVHHAAGGTITGGVPGRDSVLGLLMPGEEVINARSADRHRPLLKAINAEHFADGGTAGGWLGMTGGGGTALQQFIATLKAIEDRSDKQQARLDDLRALLRASDRFHVGPHDTASDVRSMVKAVLDALKAVVGADSPLVDHLKDVGDKLVDTSRAYDRTTQKLDDLQAQFKDIATSVTSAFQHDLFGGSLADAELQARADRNDAREARRDLAQARHRGLDPRLAAQVAASGNTALIDQLAHATPREIREFERLFRQRQRATVGLGRDVAQAVTGQDIRHQTRVLNHLDHRIGDLERVLKHLPDGVGKAVEKGAHSGNAQRQRGAAALRRVG